MSCAISPNKCFYNDHPCPGSTCIHAPPTAPPSLSWNTKIGLIEPLYEQLRNILDPNPTRSGVAETPSRVAYAWQHWAGGYDIEPADLLKTFEDGGEEYDEMVNVRNIPFYSHCEHHYAPFFGHATIAYIPSKRIVGISKLARILDAYARRFQVQERMTVQIANLLQEHLNPIGVGVYIKARHLCMESRGVNLKGGDTDTVTTRFLGAIKDQPMARAEFLGLCK